MTDRSDRPGLDVLRARLTAIAGEHLPAEDADLMVQLARPAVRLEQTSEVTGSYLGGAARLAPDMTWPTWDSTPLALLASIDLAELAPFSIDTRIPPDGILNVFYEYEEQPWGFEPEHRGGWRLVLADADRAQATSGPALTAFPSIGLRPTQILTIPGWEEPAVATTFPPFDKRSDEDERRRSSFFALEEAWTNVIGADTSPFHMVGGWPRLIQAPVWRECEVASRGIPYGTALEQETAASIADGLDDWRLLLQIDSDDDTGWMFGDDGALFLSTRRSLDVRQSLADAWLTLQCS